MDTLQCAIVLAKLERFEWEIAQRLALGQRYRELLQGLPGLRLLGTRADRDCVWAQFTVFAEDRAALVSALTQQGIPTAIHYPKPLHRQPAYAALCCPDCCPHSERAAETVLSLPMSADLTHAQQDRVVAALTQALAR